MELRNEETLTLDDFLACCRAEVEVPASESTVRRMAEFVKDVDFRVYETSSRALIAAGTLSALDTDPERRRWISPDEPADLERRSMSLKELAEHSELFHSKLAQLAAERVERPRRQSPRAMMLHCSSCQGRWAFDGNHELLRLVDSGLDATVRVTEMSSPDWRGQLRACRCSTKTSP